MTFPVTKIFENFNISWDPEIITKNFPNIYTADRNLYSSETLEPHWQHFSGNIMFARNFYNNFINECNEVAIKLTELQKSISNVTNNILINHFKKEKIEPKKFNIIRTLPGKNVSLHKDITRQMCLNIGLKNSDKWQTHISTDPEIQNFNNSTKISFTMKDGDGYLLDIKNPHTVECINKNDLTTVRYILTYTIC